VKFNLSTGTLYIYPLRTVLRWAREAGFDGVELVVNPEAIARGGQAVRRLADAEKMPIESVHPTVVPLPGWWERRGGMDRTIPLAREIGAQTVVMHTPKVHSLEVGAGLAFRQRVETWQTRLAGGSLRLAIENKNIHSPADWRYALTSLERLRAFADRYDLGLVLDTTHAGTAGADLLCARQLFDGRLAEVHLSDQGGRPPLPMLPLPEDMWSQHRFPGTGDLTLVELLAALAGDGYAGPVILEVHPLALHLWWPPAVRRRLARAVAWMRAAAGQAAGHPGA